MTKVLISNLGYCKGHNGDISDYIIKSYRFLYTSKKIQKDILDRFEKLLFKEKPDLICINEIKKDQMKYLANANYSVDIKYGKNSFLRKLPWMNNCNGIISKYKYKKGYLKNGTKKLYYVVSLPKGVTLFTTHFSLIKSTRVKQFKEVVNLMKNKKKVIVTGDFNISDFKELDYLLEKLNLNITNNQPTFPVNNPKKHYDLFLCSKNIKAKAKVLKHKLSDHLMVELKI